MQKNIIIVSRNHKAVYNIDGVNDVASSNKALQQILYKVHVQIVKEGNEQHYHARLAMSSYYHHKPEHVQKLLYVMHENRDFKIDKALSTEEHAILYNNDEVVVAYRGTSSVPDVRSYIMIILSK